jgi:hypothetical protein
MKTLVLMAMTLQAAMSYPGIAGAHAPVALTRQAVQPASSISADFLQVADDDGEPAPAPEPSPPPRGSNCDDPDATVCSAQ